MQRKRTKAWKMPENTIYVETHLQSEGNYDYSCKYIYCEYCYKMGLNMSIIEIVKNLKRVPLNKWFKVINKEGDDMTQVIKDLIDSREQFEFSDDYRYFRRLDDSWLLNK